MAVCLSCASAADVRRPTPVPFRGAARPRMQPWLQEGGLWAATRSVGFDGAQLVEGFLLRLVFRQTRSV
eukprot:6218145-Amphidinium_carterae.1